MLFCSKEFIFVFLPILLIIYYAVPWRFKNLVVFIGSLIFYAFGELKYIPLILISLVLNYVFALLIESKKRGNGYRNKSARNLRICFLVLSLLYNFGMLFIFKYFKFFTGIDNGLTLPLGISFYTFQIVSYVIDVFRDDVKAEKNIVNLGVYLCMFPQLIAGPIVIYSDVEKQIKKRRHSLDLFQDGIRVFTIGLAFKMIIANVCGMCWNSTQMYGIEGISTPMAWIGMFAYTFQIYFDFYGYSLMAIGLGKMIGFKLPTNFNNPYMATSVTDFWRRWHITLSRWFRDYVYIPLGGSRCSMPRTILNMFIVWALTGLWHGASLNFVLWGLFFFVFLTLEKLGLKKLFDRFPVIGHMYIIFLIPLGWMIFAIENVSDIGLYFTRLFPFFGSSTVSHFNNTDYITAINNYWFFFILAIFFSTGIWQKLYKRFKHSVVTSVIILAVFWISVYLVFTMENNPFLYFRF